MQSVIALPSMGPPPGPLNSKKPAPNRVKEQPQRKYKLMSYERALKMLKNDICVALIGPTDFDIFSPSKWIFREKVRELSLVSI